MKRFLPDDDLGREVRSKYDLGPPRGPMIGSSSLLSSSISSAASSSAGTTALSGSALAAIVGGDAALSSLPFREQKELFGSTQIVQRVQLLVQNGQLAEATAVVTSILLHLSETILGADPAVQDQLRTIALSFPQLFRSNAMLDRFLLWLCPDPRRPVKRTVPMLSLSCSLLWHTLHEERQWPMSLALAFVDDMLKDRSWSKFDAAMGDAFLLVEKLRNSICRKTTVRSHEEDSDSVYGTSAAVVQLEQHLEQRLREGIKSLDTARILDVLPSFLCYPRMRLLASEWLEEWINHQVFSKFLKDLLDSLARYCDPSTPSDRDVLKNLLALKPKTVSLPLVMSAIERIAKLDHSMHSLALRLILTSLVYGQVAKDAVDTTWSLTNRLLEDCSTRDVDFAEVLAEAVLDNILPSLVFDFLLQVSVHCSSFIALGFLSHYWSSASRLSRVDVSLRAHIAELFVETSCSCCFLSMARALANGVSKEAMTTISSVLTSAIARVPVLVSHCSEAGVDEAFVLHLLSQALLLAGADSYILIRQSRECFDAVVEQCSSLRSSLPVEEQCICEIATIQLSVPKQHILGILQTVTMRAVAFSQFQEDAGHASPANTGICVRDDETIDAVFSLAYDAGERKFNAALLWDALVVVCTMSAFNVQSVGARAWARYPVVRFILAALMKEDWKGLFRHSDGRSSPSISDSFELTSDASNFRPSMGEVEVLQTLDRMAAIGKRLRRCTSPNLFGEVIGSTLEQWKASGAVPSWMFTLVEDDPVILQTLPMSMLSQLLGEFGRRLFVRSVRALVELVEPMLSASATDPSVLVAVARLLSHDVESVRDQSRTALSRVFGTAWVERMLSEIGPEDGLVCLLDWLVVEDRHVLVDHVCRQAIAVSESPELLLSFFDRTLGAIDKLLDCLARDPELGRLVVEKAVGLLVTGRGTPSSCRWLAQLSRLPFYSPQWVSDVAVQACCDIVRGQSESSLLPFLLSQDGRLSGFARLQTPIRDILVLASSSVLTRSERLFLLHILSSAPTDAVRQEIMSLDWSQKHALRSVSISSALPETLTWLQKLFGQPSSDDKDVMSDSHPEEVVSRSGPAVAQSPPNVQWESPTGRSDCVLNLSREIVNDSDPCSKLVAVAQSPQRILLELVFEHLAMTNAQLIQAAEREPSLLALVLPLVGRSRIRAGGGGYFLKGSSAVATVRPVEHDSNGTYDETILASARRFGLKDVLEVKRVSEIQWSSVMEFLSANEPLHGGNDDLELGLSVAVGVIHERTSNKESSGPEASRMGPGADILAFLKPYLASAVSEGRMNRVVQCFHKLGSAVHLRDSVRSCFVLIYSGLASVLPGELFPVPVLASDAGARNASDLDTFVGRLLVELSQEEEVNSVAYLTLRQLCHLHPKLLVRFVPSFSALLVQSAIISIDVFERKALSRFYLQVLGLLDALRPVVFQLENDLNEALDRFISLFGQASEDVHTSVVPLLAQFCTFSRVCLRQDVLSVPSVVSSLPIFEALLETYRPLEVAGLSGLVDDLRSVVRAVPLVHSSPSGLCGSFGPQGPEVASLRSEVLSASSLLWDSSNVKLRRLLELLEADIDHVLWREWVLPLVPDLLRLLSTSDNTIRSRVFDLLVGVMRVDASVCPSLALRFLEEMQRPEAGVSKMSLGYFLASRCHRFFAMAAPYQTDLMRVLYTTPDAAVLSLRQVISQSRSVPPHHQTSTL